MSNSLRSYYSYTVFSRNTSLLRNMHDLQDNSFSDSFASHAASSESGLQDFLKASGIQQHPCSILLHNDLAECVVVPLVGERRKRCAHEVGVMAAATLSQSAAVEAQV